MSTLRDGHYTITSANSYYIVGRRPHEDKSLNPKGIFTLDPGVGTEHGRRVSTRADISFNGSLTVHHMQWTIKHVDGNKYKLQAGGAPVGSKDGKLWAFLTEHDDVNEWVVEDISHQGEHQYMLVLVAPYPCEN